MPKRDTIALVYATTSLIPYHAHSPLSILATGAYLEGAGFRVIYFDERFDKAHTFFTELSTARARLLYIGFSLIASPQITAALALARRCARFCPEVPRIFGGVHPTLVPESVLAHPLADAVILGEGEIPALALAQSLARGEARPAIANVIFRGMTTATEDFVPSVLPAALLPFPYATAYGAALLQRCPPLSISYELSRGCPCRCAFCYNVAFRHSIPRTKPLATVIAELRELHARGVRRLQFVDDNFSGGRAYLDQLLAVLRELDFRWSLGLSITQIDAPLVNALNTSGCEWLFFGLEALDDRLLAAVDKPQTAAGIMAGVRALRDARFAVTYSFISGFPPPLAGNDERAELARSMADARRINELHPTAEIVIQPYLPVPRTPLEGMARAHGYVPPAQLTDWARHTADHTRMPWHRHPRRFRFLYLISFLAFRHQRTNKTQPLTLPLIVLHYIARWRWRHDCFAFPVELGLLRLYELPARLLLWWRNCTA